jgi:hypothetical protein
MAPGTSQQRSVGAAGVNAYTVGGDMTSRDGSFWNWRGRPPKARSRGRLPPVARGTAMRHWSG